MKILGWGCRGGQSLWTGMRNLSWFMFGVKYYLEIWFLHTTRLLRHQISQKNVKKTTNFFEGHSKDHSSISPKNIFFWLIWTILTWEFSRSKKFDPQGHKGQKDQQRPNVSKLDFRIFRGLTMVPQHAKRSYKVTWRPIEIRFWEMTTPEPKMGPADQKISSDKIFLKIKKNH